MQQDDSSCTLLSSLDSFALHSSDNLCQPVSGGDSWAITYINPDVMSPCVEVLRHWSAVSAAVITAVHHSLQSVALSQTVESAFKTATLVNFKSNLKKCHIWDYVHIHNTQTWSIFISVLIQFLVMSPCSVKELLLIVNYNFNHIFYHIILFFYINSTCPLPRLAERSAA